MKVVKNAVHNFFLKKKKKMQSVSILPHVIHSICLSRGVCPGIWHNIYLWRWLNFLGLHSIYLMRQTLLTQYLSRHLSQAHSISLLWWFNFTISGHSIYFRLQRGDGTWQWPNFMVSNHNIYLKLHGICLSIYLVASCDDSISQYLLLTQFHSISTQVTQVTQYLSYEAWASI